MIDDCCRYLRFCGHLASPNDSVEVLVCIQFEFGDDLRSSFYCLTKVLRYVQLKCIPYFDAINKNYRMTIH